MRSQAPDGSLLPLRPGLVENRHSAKADPAALAALHRLGQFIGYLLYAYARCAGLSPAEAENALRSFFPSLLQSVFFARAQPENGLLHPFLLSCLKPHLADRRRPG